MEGQALASQETAQLVLKEVDLATFEENPHLGVNRSYILQLKGFNRLERIKRRIDQSKEKVAGSKERRIIAQGAIMGFDSFPSNQPISQADSAFQYDLPDSRGLYVDKTRVFCGSVDKVLQINCESKQISEIKNPWLAFVHSLDLSSDKKRLLVASSGFDRIMEFDTVTAKAVWEWSAWDHGYNRANASGKLVSSRPLSGNDNDQDVLVIDDPVKYSGGLGLPPADRTAFPNSVLYKDEDHILATLYHNGLIEIDKKAGSVKPIYKDLKHPHAIYRYNGGYLVTDTGNGKFVLFNENLKPKTIYSIANIMGKTEGEDSFEWLQQAKPLEGGLLAAVDSARAAIYIVDISKQEINKFPYNQNWVVQEIAEADRSVINSLRTVLKGIELTG